MVLGFEVEPVMTVFTDQRTAIGGENTSALPLQYVRFFIFAKKITSDIKNHVGFSQKAVFL